MLRDGSGDVALTHFEFGPALHFFTAQLSAGRHALSWAVTVTQVKTYRKSFDSVERSFAFCLVAKFRLV